MSLNIYQIQQDLLNIYDELEENGGELTKELEELLTITQENFKTKVEGYTNIIKSINADIDAIDTETKRLAELKKSKAKVVERLNNTLIDAINQFGETSKSGSKFFDYGTGKVSIRKSVKVETDEDKLKCMASEYASCISFENMLAGASNRENITFNEMIQRCKEHKKAESDIIVDDPQDITREDIETAQFEVTIRAGLEDMCSEDGYHAIKNLTQEFGTKLFITPKIDKPLLKSYLTKNKDNEVTIGRLVNNQTLSIK